MTEHRTYCRICPVLCGLVVTTEGDHVVRVRGDDEHPLSAGYTCPKGRALGAFHHHPHRLDEPEVRGSGVARTGWDGVLDDLAARITAAVDDAGPDAVAVYNGTWSWFDALGRRAADRLLDRLGSRSRYSALTVDAVARSYVSERMAGVAHLIPQIDPDTPTLTLLFGTNPVISHGHASALVDPIRRLRALAARGGLWVVDPLRTETARLATRHLPARAGTDPALVAFLVRELLIDGADRDYLAAHATGVEDLARATAPWTRERASAHTGLPEADLDDLLGAVRASGRLTALSGTGVTMSTEGVVTEWLLWALQAVTGSWERPGGPWCNPGYFLRLDQRTPRRGRASSGDGSSGGGSSDDGAAPGPRSRPDLPGRFGELPCAGLVDEIDAGAVRVLLVLGGNPVTSLPDTPRLTSAFRRLDALAVADVIESDTVRLATHVLPVAGQLERTDITYLVDLFPSMVSAQHTPPVVPPAAGRRPLWWVMAQLGSRLGFDVLPDGLDASCTDADLVAAVTRRSPSSFDGFADGAHVLVADDPRPRGWIHERVLPDGRWRLAPPELVARLDALADPPPLVLTPRRVMRRMNSALRDVHAPGGRLDPTDVLVHPDDAAAAGVAGAGRAVLRSPAGAVAVVVRETVDVRAGTVSVPHGLVDQNVGRLTTGAAGTTDPLTGMVVQSGLPVSLAPVDGPDPT